MKKIPTLFERVFENNRIIGITDKVHDGMEWVLNGEGIATIKYDGACCAVLCGAFYKRYDAKNGKNPPEGAIPCCPPDPITGHHPHWIRIDCNNPSDKWFVSAFKNTITKYSGMLPYGTYEAIGKHFNGNPYKLNDDMLIRHGDALVTVERSFEGIKKYLENNEVEGLVFWKEGEPQCKSKGLTLDLLGGKVMTFKQKIKSCLNILFKRQKPQQIIEHKVGVKWCYKCDKNIRCDECVYKKMFEADSKSHEKCPICNYSFNVCQCRFSGSAHPDRSKRKFVVFEHLYLLTPAQLMHVIKLQKYFQISYRDDEKEKIVADLKKEAIHPIGDKI